MAAFAEARRLRAAGSGWGDPALGEALAEARRLAPGWVPPSRMEDDLLIRELRQVEALERRRNEREADPEDPRAAYLMARLESAQDPAGFARALEVDPGFAWSLHGHAYTRSLQGDASKPLIDEWSLAIQRAPTSWESAYMGLRLALVVQEWRSSSGARGILNQLLELPRLTARDRAWLEVELTLMELRTGLSETREMGVARGLRLLRDPALDPADALGLVLGMNEFVVRRPEVQARVEHLLAEREGIAWERLRVQHLEARGQLALARAAALESGDAELAARWQGASSVAPSWGVDPGARYDRWLLGLPGQVLARDGEPASPGHQRVGVLAHQVSEDPASVVGWRELGAALIDVGWYEAAGQVAERLAELDTGLGLELQGAAVEGLGLMGSLEQVLVGLEAGWGPALTEPYPGTESHEPDEDEGHGASPGVQGVGSGSLEDLLFRWAGVFGEVSGRSQEELAREFIEAPRLGLSGVGELVEPVSSEGAAEGSGASGVTGLSAELAARGRFAIVGKQLGQAPDAVVLRTLLVSEERGELLGVPWSGTVAICDGADVRNRAQRRGLLIGGAALHEGYYLDLEQLRPDHRRWQALRARFSGGPEDQERVDRALSTPGLRLRAGFGTPRARRAEQVTMRPSLGQADRLRLAVMRDRALPGEVLGEVSFSELVEATAIHEQAHLCDRTRFLPLGRNAVELARLLLEAALTPGAIQQRLEYRAELTALCEVEDPRLVLVHLVSAVDEDLSLLGHGPAFRRLLSELLELLADELASEPEAWPELSSAHSLLHQLHHLGPERLRELGLELARRERLMLD